MTVEAGVMDRIELSELIDIEIGCEHSLHTGDPDSHEGNAKWIQRLGACECGDAGMIFVCQKWRDWVRQAAKQNKTLMCRTCTTGWPAKQVTYTKI